MRIDVSMDVFADAIPGLNVFKGDAILSECHVINLNPLAHHHILIGFKRPGFCVPLGERSFALDTQGRNGFGNKAYAHQLLQHTTDYNHP